MEKEVIIKITIFVLSILIGYVIGRIVSYYKNRIQCVNCGGYNTYLGASGYGGEGGEYPHAVKHWEGHMCKDCGEGTSIKMSLIKIKTKNEKRICQL
jgi:hypothetical protein